MGQAWPSNLPSTHYSEPSAKHALPNTASSAQCSLSPRTATRPSHVLGASRSLGDTVLYSLRPPAAYSCQCAHSNAPFSVLLAAFLSLRSMTRRGHKLECTGDISLAAREAQADRSIFGNLVSPRTLDYAHLHPSITLARPIVPSCRVVPAPCDRVMGRQLCACSYISPDCRRRAASNYTSFR